MTAEYLLYTQEALYWVVGIYSRLHRTSIGGKWRKDQNSECISLCSKFLFSPTLTSSLCLRFLCQVSSLLLHIQRLVWPGPHLLSPALTTNETHLVLTKCLCCSWFSCQWAVSLLSWTIFPLNRSHISFPVQMTHMRVSVTFSLGSRCTVSLTSGYFHLPHTEVTPASELPSKGI